MFKRIITFFFSGLMFMVLGGAVNIVFAQPSTGLDDLFESGEPERIATGFSFTEGPVWHPDGYLLFSDIRDNTIYKWTPDGEVKKFRSPSGHSNGLTFDNPGRLIACEHSNAKR